MIRSVFCAGGALIAFGLAAVASASAPEGPGTQLGAQPILFSAQSRIEVDADGAVVAVAPTPSLPEAVNAALAENLGKLRFVPATREGRAVGGVTYARQEACAVPDGASYRMSVRFLGNGPGTPKGGDRLIVPRFPPDAQRAGAAAEVKLAYRVEPDGSVTVESAESVGARGRYTRDFVAATRHWMDGQTAEPEYLDGQPVATRVSTTVKFTSGVTFTGPNARAQVERHVREQKALAEQARIASSAACATASQARAALPQQVAVNSPFKPMRVE